MILCMLDLQFEMVERTGKRGWCLYNFVYAILDLAKLEMVERTLEM